MESDGQQARCTPLLLLPSFPPGSCHESLHAADLLCGFASQGCVLMSKALNSVLIPDMVVSTLAVLLSCVLRIFLESLSACPFTSLLHSAGRTHCTQADRLLFSCFLLTDWEVPLWCSQQTLRVPTLASVRFAHIQGFLEDEYMELLGHRKTHPKFR